MINVSGVWVNKYIIAINQVKVKLKYKKIIATDFVAHVFTVFLLSRNIFKYYKTVMYWACLFSSSRITFTSRGATPAFFVSTTNSAGFPCITPFGCSPLP